MIILEAHVFERMTQVAITSLRKAKPLNTREGFDMGIAGVRASRAELRVYDAIMGGAPAAFTGKTGWSGG